MTKLISFIFAVVLCTMPGIAGGTANLDEDQWLYRANGGDAKHPPVAVFLSWDYSAVLFRAKCERGNLLVIEYFGDGTPLKGRKLSIGADNAASDDNTAGKYFRMKTVLKTYGANQILEGQIAVSPEFASAIVSADHVAIDAPNEMGEEWHTGSALPLKRIVRACH